MTTPIEEKLRKLGGILGKKIRKLQWAYQGESNGERKRHLEIYINLLYSNHFGFDDAILLLPPPAATCQAKYLLGAVQYNGKNLRPFGLTSQDLLQHTVIAGRSGSGKSNLMLYLAKQFIKSKKPFLLFSFKKEYRQLVAWAKAEGTEILLFTGGRPHAEFRFNPLLLPKGADKETYINFLAEAIASVYFLKEGAISFLRAGLSEIYDKHRTPKLIHLKEWVENQSSKGRAGEWLASTKRVLDALCFGRINDVLNSDNAVDFETLLHKQVILELDNFNDDDRTFIIQCLFRWLYQYALENFKRGSLQYLLLVDEAHHLFLKQGNEETFNDSLIRKIRELGIGLVLGDQHPSLLSLPALGNSLTTIVLNLKTQADVTAISGALLLDAEQKKFIGLLPRGHAIVRQPDRFPTPFLIQIPRVDLPQEPMTNAMVADYMKQPLIELRRLSTVSAPYAPENDAFRGLHPKDSGWPADGVESDELSPLHQGLLTNVLNFPFMGTNNRYLQLKVSIRHGSQAKDWLVGRGYLKSVTVNIYKNTMVLFDLTEKAVSFLENKGIKVRLPANEGGVEHRFAVWQVKKHFEKQGYSVETEVKTSQGKFIDVVARKENKAVALLVETGKSNIESNIEAAKQAGFSDIRIIATNRDVLSKKFSVPVIYLPDLQRDIDGEKP